MWNKGAFIERTPHRRKSRSGDIRRCVKKNEFDRIRYTWIRIRKFTLCTRQGCTWDFFRGALKKFIHTDHGHHHRQLLKAKSCRRSYSCLSFAVFLCETKMENSSEDRFTRSSTCYFIAYFIFQIDGDERVVSQQTSD